MTRAPSDRRWKSDCARSVAGMWVGCESGSRWSACSYDSRAGPRAIGFSRAESLEPRLREAARSTVDMDLGIELEVASLAVPVGEGVRERLQEDAAGSGDHLFEFVFPGSKRPRDRRRQRSSVSGDCIAGRASLRSLSARRRARRAGFHPDRGGLGSGLLSFAEIPVERFRVVSRARHFAEKIHAYTTPHEHRTRVKDLSRSPVARRARTSTDCRAPGAARPRLRKACSSSHAGTAVRPSARVEEPIRSGGASNRTRANDLRSGNGETSPSLDRHDF